MLASTSLLLERDLSWIFVLVRLLSPIPVVGVVVVVTQILLLPLLLFLHLPLVLLPPTLLLIH
jgi:hypothetical protein